MSDHDFENYLALVGKLLRLSGKQREQISGELRSHLEERLDELLLQGVPRDRAVRIALEEFGDAAVLAADFVSLSRNRRRRWLMRAVSFSAAAIILFAVGIAIFWPGRNAAPGAAEAVAQEADAQNPETKPAEADPSDDSGKSKEQGKTLADKLNARVDVDFNDTSLGDALAILSQQTGVQFYVPAKKLEEAGLTVDMPVSQHLHQVRLSTVLDLMLNDFELTYCEKDDDLIVVTTHEDAESVLEVRVYDCRDLLALPTPMPAATGREADKRPALPPPGAGAALPPPVTTSVSAPPARIPLTIMPQFGGLGGIRPPAAGDNAEAGTGGGGFQSEPRTEHQKQADSLILLITTNVEPQAWDEVGGPGSISEYHGLIVVTQTAQIHKKVERVLDMLREAAGLDVPKTGKVVR